MAPHTPITRQAAQAIESKLYSIDTPLAVFAEYGAIRTTKAGTKRFDKLIATVPDQLVGVYTAEVPITVLEEDLLLAGVK